MSGALNIPRSAMQPSVSSPERTAEPAITTANSTTREEAERALKRLPEVRPEAVAHAKALLSDPEYPSANTLRRVANLLASKWDRSRA